MDNALSGTIWGVSTASIFALAFGIYKCINHHRLVSKCCDRRFEMSLDIDETPRPGDSPTNQTPLKISIPDAKPNPTV